MESQKDFRIQRDEQHEMMQKFNNLMIDNKRLVADNDHKSNQLKQVSLSRTITVKKTREISKIGPKSPVGEPGAKES